MNRFIRKADTLYSRHASMLFLVLCLSCSTKIDASAFVTLATSAGYLSWWELRGIDCVGLNGKVSDKYYSEYITSLQMKYVDLNVEFANCSEVSLRLMTQHWIWWSDYTGQEGSYKYRPPTKFVNQGLRPIPWFPRESTRYWKVIGGENNDQEIGGEGLRGDWNTIHLRMQGWSWDPYMDKSVIEPWWEPFIDDTCGKGMACG